MLRQRLLQEVGQLLDHLADLGVLDAIELCLIEHAHTPCRDDKMGKTIYYDMQEPTSSTSKNGDVFFTSEYRITGLPGIIEEIHDHRAVVTGVEEGAPDRCRPEAGDAVRSGRKAPP